MKSIVFSFKKRYLFRRSKGISPSDVRFFIRRYSVVLIFVSAFLIGLVFGSIYASKPISKCLIPLIFCLLQILMRGSVRMPSAHFVPALHLILYFSRLYSSWDLHRGEYRFCRLFQHLKALEQDLLRHILLLHIHLKEQVFICSLCCREHFLFCLALVKLSAYAFEISKQMFFSLIGHSHQTNSLKNEVIDFCSRSVSALIMTFCSTLLDTALWCLFSGAFNF